VFTGACTRDVCKAIDLGVQGMVSKDKPKQVLAQCIQSVYAGKKWLDKDLTIDTLTHLLDKKTIHASLPDVLTAREMVVAKMVSEGLPNKKLHSTSTSPKARPNCICITFTKNSIALDGLLWRCICKVTVWHNPFDIPPFVCCRAL